MDEPPSNLNAKLRVQMRSELKRFQRDLHATVVYVTHDQLEAVTMAGKMAVMNGGFLQQYDTPAKVFEHPVNMFVASFAGSPAMSLVPLDTVTTGTEVALHSPAGWTLPLDAANGRKALSATTNQVVLGARHSTLKLRKSKAGASVPGKVYTVEPTGDITFVAVHLGTATVIVSLEPHVAIEPDEPVWIEFGQKKLYHFDGATEQALAAG